MQRREVQVGIGDGHVDVGVRQQQVHDTRAAELQLLRRQHQRRVACTVRSAAEMLYSVSRCGGVVDVCGTHEGQH